MSRDEVENLIESASNYKNPLYLRKGWIIMAKSRLQQLDEKLKVLEDKIKKEKTEIKER